MDKDAYSESTRAIGKLFRAIDLPELGEARVARKQRQGMEAMNGSVLERFYAENDTEDEVMAAVRMRISCFIDVNDFDDNTIVATCGCIAFTDLDFGLSAHTMS